MGGMDVGVCVAGLEVNVAVGAWGVAVAGGSVGSTEDGVQATIQARSKANVNRRKDFMSTAIDPSNVMSEA